MKSNKTQQQAIQNLEGFLGDLGQQLGMPDPDDHDAYQSECPHCDWRGQITQTIFRDGEFYCPACDHMFVARKE